MTQFYSTRTGSLSPYPHWAKLKWPKTTTVLTIDINLIHSFIPDIYIAPLQETYSEALSVHNHSPLSKSKSLSLLPTPTDDPKNKTFEKQDKHHRCIKSSSSFTKNFGITPPWQWVKMANQWVKYSYLHCFSAVRTKPHKRNAYGYIMRSVRASWAVLKSRVL